MGRQDRLKYLAEEAAHHSTCKSRHGALIVHGNRLKAVGYNNHLRTSFLGKLDICQHAEMNAVTAYMNAYMRRVPHHKRQRKLSNLTVWSVKLSGNSFGNALPCAICLHRLQQVGFGKLVYSTQTGGVKMVDLRSVTNSHVSLVQKRYQHLIRW